MRDLPANSLDGQVGHVAHRERQIQEERFSSGVLPLHEVDRLADQFVVDACANLRRERLDVVQRTARRAFDDLRSLGEQHCIRRLNRVRERDRVHICSRVPGHIGRDAIELVEAVRGRQALRIRSEVPLAKDRRGITKPVEHVPHRVGVGRERGVAAGDDDQRQAVADRVLPGHQRRARGRAGRLDQELGQPQPFAGEFIDAGCRRAPQLSAAIGLPYSHI